ncbi:hypothetical protein MESS2_610055 [Mesorhizobium metallidurans STM 2683]|uniref:Uncharacterized protein n=1 Tax=Mesorhizobium metallidurans STM 2683 TaxID=1297569 RepID=M5ERV6_9HYPH|nr:hypothetical protein MESS2_610055 [Mesorhizobium metallidurans STM 2683]
METRPMASKWRREGCGGVAQACWSFRKQRLPHYCAVQHEIACFEAKFCVTISPALG